jgi:hypothetical protein
MEMEAHHSLLQRGTDGCCGGDSVGDSDLAGLAPRLDFLCCPLVGLITVAGYMLMQRRAPWLRGGGGEGGGESGSRVSPGRN